MTLASCSASSMRSTSCLREGFRSSFAGEEGFPSSVRLSCKHVCLRESALPSPQANRRFFSQTGLSDSGIPSAAKAPLGCVKPRSAQLGA